MMDTYTIPWIDKLTDRLGQSNFISAVDLTWGYWKVAMVKEAKVKTAFVTPFGLFQFNVKSIGLQGAPATFRRLMDHGIHRMQQLTWLFLADVGLTTWNTYQQSYSGLEKLASTVKARKCQLEVEECVYSGHIIISGIVKSDLGKLEAVRHFSITWTKKQVRAFLGLAGYYRWFIPNFQQWHLH